MNKRMLPKSLKYFARSNIALLQYLIFQRIPSIQLASKIVCTKIYSLIQATWNLIKTRFFLYLMKKTHGWNFLMMFESELDKNHFSAPVRGRVRSKFQSLEILRRFEKWTVLVTSLSLTCSKQFYLAYSNSVLPVLELSLSECETGRGPSLTSHFWFLPNSDQ